VVDDGSTDASIETIERAMADFRQADTLLHRQSNHGAHAAINTGIKLSSGQCIAILNSDDGYAPGRIRRIVEAAADRPLFFVFTGIDFIDESGAPLGSEHPHTRWYRRIMGNLETAPTLGFRLLQDNISVTSGNFAFSRALYDRLGGFSGYEFCHDWDFIMRATRLVEPDFLDAPLLRYRAHDSNTTHSLRGVQEEEVSTALNRFLRLCATEGAPNPLAPCPQNWPNFFDVYARKTLFHFDSEPIAAYIDQPGQASTP
jgi:glycosyltransferase involved in cell wall biosynthesis